MILEKHAVFSLLKAPLQQRPHLTTKKIKRPSLIYAPALIKRVKGARNRKNRQFNFTQNMFKKILQYDKIYLK